jgi:hypothetical protein
MWVQEVDIVNRIFIEHIGAEIEVPVRVQLPEPLKIRKRRIYWDFLIFGIGFILLVLGSMASFVIVAAAVARILVP